MNDARGTAEPPSDPVDLVAKAGQLAARYEELYHGCAQCVLLAVQDTLELESPDTFKAITGLSGGLGCLGHVCGALTGGIVALGLVVGRTPRDLRTQSRVHWENYKLVKELVDRFISEFGADLSCRAIQTQMLGRSFDLWKPEDQVAFKALGGTSSGCAHVASALARWTVDILTRH
jgi:C_GCAxxG_C_C family probable redox protein